MDILNKRERSRRMSAVRSIGNRSTEWRFRAKLIREGISGWELHPPDVPGKPDFLFRKLRLAIFIDGCFWHGCPNCRRPMPAANREYWSAKIATNIARRQDVIRQLRRIRFKTIQIWEHELRTKKSQVFTRLLRLLSTTDRTRKSAS